MDYSQITTAAGYLIYGALGIVAVWGVFCVLLLLRRIETKRFRARESEALFFSKLRERLRTADYDGAVKVCNNPSYWDRAVSRLAALAIENRHQGLAKIRRLMAEHFERDVLADLEYRLSWVYTVIKSAPMLGLLGTVVGMIGAFGKIAGTERPDPTMLAGDISLALFTTAAGLAIAIPLVLCGAYINARIRRLEDSVAEGVGHFLEEFAEAEGAEPTRQPPQYAEP